jgi:hypothetical protein
MRRVIAGSLGVAVSLTAGCANAPKHVGTWAYEDAETYVGYELKRDDTCRFIGAAKGQAGLGGYCRFERQEHTMRIVEVWGNTGPRWKLPAKFTMTYDPDTDTLTLHEGDRSIRLSRTSRLLGE